jgi:hypothetical protein
MSDDEYGGYDGDYNEDNYGDRERVGGVDEKKIGETNFSDRIRGSEIDKFKGAIDSANKNLIQNDFDIAEYGIPLENILHLAEKEIQPEYRHPGTFLLAGFLFLKKDKGEYDSLKERIFELITRNKNDNYENKNIPSREDLFRYYKLFS